MSQMENRQEVPALTPRNFLWQSIRRVWRMLAHNFPLKLISLFLAVLLWSALVASDASLTREKVFANAEVSVVGVESLRARGLVVRENVSELIPTVRFSAEVPQGSYTRAQAASFGPRIDLSRISQVGEQDVAVTMNASASGTVRDIEPASVRVTVEEYKNIYRVPAVVQQVGTLSPDLWADTPRVDPALVTVSGPKSLADQVARVAVKLDLSALRGDSATVRNALPFVIQDAKGNELDAAQLHVTTTDIALNKLLVDVNCYPQKMVPITIDDVIEGEPGRGYVLTDVDILPNEVLISASQSVLDTISRVIVEAPLKIEGAEQSQEMILRVKRPADVKHISAEEIRVSAKIEEDDDERLLRNITIEPSGLSGDATIKLSRTRTNVTVYGKYFTLGNFKAEQVKLYVDVADLTPGEYDLPVMVEVIGPDPVQCAPEVETIHVTIAQKP